MKMELDEYIKIYQPMERVKDCCWQTVGAISYTCALEVKSKLQQKYRGNKVFLYPDTSHNKVMIYFRNEAEESTFIMRESI
jgi:hypothetical protein